LENTKPQFAFGSAWVGNMVSDIKGGTQSVWEQGAVENI
jgi:hypothetical protein